VEREWLADVKVGITVTITYLHHTDFALPYYPPSSFTFLRGAASTIDRDFGFIGRHLFHGAINTHVLHHHCSKIPFYYAQEASVAMKKVMGEAYISDFEGSYLAAFWRNYRTCSYVEPVMGKGEGKTESREKGEGDVFFFHGSGNVGGKA
jgi:fatty acid desaturase